MSAAVSVRYFRGFHCPASAVWSLAIASFFDLRLRRTVVCPSRKKRLPPARVSTVGASCWIRDQGPLDYTGLERLIGTQAIYVGQSKAAGTLWHASPAKSWMLRGGPLVINLGSSQKTRMGNLADKNPPDTKKPWKSKDESLTSTRNHNKQHTNIYFPLSETAIVLALWNVSQVHLASRCRASYWRDAAATLCWLLKKGTENTCLIPT